MKIALLLLTAAALATAAGNLSLSGKWRIHSNISGNENDQTCTFTQTDNDLAGSCTTDSGVAKVTGKIDGKKVTWSFKSEYNGSPLTVNYEGTVNSETKISGTVNVPEYSADGDFTATLSK